MFASTFLSAATALFFFAPAVLSAPVIPSVTTITTKTVDVTDVTGVVNGVVVPQVGVYATLTQLQGQVKTITTKISSVEYTTIDADVVASLKLNVGDLVTVITGAVTQLKTLVLTDVETLDVKVALAGLKVDISVTDIVTLLGAIIVDILTVLAVVITKVQLLPADVAALLVQLGGVISLLVSTVLAVLGAVVGTVLGAALGEVSLLVTLVAGLLAKVELTVGTVVALVSTLKITVFFSYFNIAA